MEIVAEKEKGQIDPTENYFEELKELIDFGNESSFAAIAEAGELKQQAQHPPASTTPTAQCAANSFGSLYIPLGMSEKNSRCVIWHIESQQIIELGTKDLSESRFDQLFSDEDISVICPRLSKDGLVEGADYRAFRKLFTKECRVAGKYMSKTIRSAGVWKDPKDNTNLIVNSLKLSNLKAKPIPRVEIGRKEVYVADGDLGDPLNSAPANKKQVRELLRALRTWGFAKKSDALLCLGWIALTSYTGALDWRPHIYVTAEPGYGKSELEQLVFDVKPIDQSKEEGPLDGNTTEAGIRQRFKSKALSLVIDEREAKEKADGRAEAFDQLLTTSSSGGSILKGTQDQEGRSDDVFFMAFMAGVNPPSRSAALASRCVVLRLDKQPDPAKKPAILGHASALRIPLFSRMLTSWEAFNENLALVKQAMIERKYTARLADTYGSLIAGAATCFYGKTLNRKFVNRLLNLFSLEDQIAESSKSNKDLCLAHILEQRIDVSLDGAREKYSVSEVLRMAVKERHGRSLTPYDEALRSNGLNAERNENSIHLFVANDHSQVSALYKGTAWEKTYAQMLLRIEGAESKVVNFSGHSRRGVSVKTPITVNGETENEAIFSPEQEKAFAAWEAEKSIYTHMAAEVEQVFDADFGGALRRHWQGIALRFVDQGIDIQRAEELTKTHLTEKGFGIPCDDLSGAIRIGMISEIVRKKRQHR